MSDSYDVVVIGGGAAGLVAATGAAALGAKTALIDKQKLGGDCTWYGCIPSKALLKSAQVFSQLKRLKEYGIAGSTQCNADGVMAHAREVVAKISTHHPPQVFEKRGISVLFGNAHFFDQHVIELDGKDLVFKRAILCTGSHPLIPPIPGLADIDYLTNQNVFELESLPQSLIILGGGPIGVELAQVFARLGTKVTIVEMSDRLLAREDKEAADVLIQALIKDGVTIYTKKRAVQFARQEQDALITLEDEEKNRTTLRAQKILVAVGRAANIAGLGLENAGVKHTNNAAIVDRTLRTSAKNIYSCGDVAGPYQFSHMAEYQAIIAVSNALLPFKQKADYSSVPWCTFTDPELAHVGLTEDEARNRYRNIRVYRSEYAQNDRAVTDMQETGFAKVICDRYGYILGAHIVGASAGEIIHEYIAAKTWGMKLKGISSVIHIYPTLSQIVKRSADEYYLHMMLSGWFKAISKFLISFLR